MRRPGRRGATASVALPTSKMVAVVRVQVRLDRVLLTRRGNGFGRAIVRHPPQCSLYMASRRSNPNLSDNGRRRSGMLSRWCA